MAVNTLTNAVMKQLEVTGLQSLQVQNHIYGCFVVMEDLAEKTPEKSPEKSSEKEEKAEELCLKEDNYTFSVDKQFSEIGIRYGFLMDTKLIFDSFLPEYKTAWLDIFTMVHDKKAMEDVDSIEDAVIELIRTNVLSEMAFFLQSLGTGSLSKQWLNKAIVLITTGELPKDIKDSLLVKAYEKADEKPKKFRKTKRHIIVIKKLLGKTRRNVKV
jgi:hypothetical protein